MFRFRKSRWWQLKYFLFSPPFGEDSRFDEHIISKGLVQPPTRNPMGNFSGGEKNPPKSHRLPIQGMTPGLYMAFGGIGAPEIPGDGMDVNCERGIVKKYLLWKQGHRIYQNLTNRY